MRIHFTVVDYLHVGISILPHILLLLYQPLAIISHNPSILTLVLPYWPSIGLALRHQRVNAHALRLMLQLAAQGEFHGGYHEIRNPLHIP